MSTPLDDRLQSRLLLWLTLALLASFAAAFTLYALGLLTFGLLALFALWLLIFFLIISPFLIWLAYRCCAGRAPDGPRLQDGWSARSRTKVEPVPFSREPHPPWTIVQRPRHEHDNRLPRVPQGPLVGLAAPSPATGNVLDFHDGPPPSGPGAMNPVRFRTFTATELAAGWPPDMSGAKAGNVVLMTGNLWLKLSTDGGNSFTDLDFTAIFAADTTYGGWSGDQVVHYVPSIDCFVLYVQSSRSNSGATRNKNVVKVALASPADLIAHAGGRDAWWRQWDLTSDTFGLGASWMDRPDISYGEHFVHLNSFVFEERNGKLAYELPLAELAAGNGFSFLFSFDQDHWAGSPTQNVVGDEIYWAEHVNNSTIRIYSYRGGEANYSWRDRTVASWTQPANWDIVSLAPEGIDWVSTDYRIFGAARIGSVLWFAWTAERGDGGAGGFWFPHPHVRIAKFDIAQDFALVDQTQVWNANHAFAYPSLIANSDNEMGISLAWGGGPHFGSHAVGILGDFVVWYGIASTETSMRLDGGVSRWGDYVHVRLAQPARDPSGRGQAGSRWFSAFGYAVVDDPGATPTEKAQYLYVEFGRDDGRDMAPG
jgi:hypothetical protein